MKWRIVKLKTWRDWQDAIDGFDLTEQSNPGWWFRGQANSEWTLAPSLLRAIKELSPDYRRAHGIEFGALRRFEERAHLFLPADGVNRSTWLMPAWWALMQHFGCPTRILDWTESPYVALYFAAIGEMEADGAVWAFPSQRVSSTVTKRFGPPDEQGWCEDDCRESSAVYPIQLAAHSDRSASQQACFTVCADVFADHSSAIEEAVGSAVNALVKMTLPHEQKLEFLSRLRTMNITAATLFPGLDGLGRSASEYVKLRAWRSVGEQKQRVAPASAGSEAGYDIGG